MPKSIDLTGRVFGHLTVLRKGTPYVSPKGVTKVRWLCQCDCGKTIETFTTSLTSGTTKSCGHARFDYLKDKGPATSLVGRQFGHLTVIKDDGTRKGDQVMWLCQCDCGRMTHVSTSNLVTGNTISCGHIGQQSLKKYRDKYKRETPGTRLDLLGETASKNSKTGERNISVTVQSGKKRYRVAVMYKRHQYGGLCDTLEEAIELREELRRRYWPNYK